MTTISTTARPAYVYDEGEDTWYPVGAQALAFVTTYVYTATASQTVFSGPDDNSLTLSYTTGAVKVFLNGVLLTPSQDYSASNGTSVTLGSGAAENDVLIVLASDTYEVADTYTQSATESLINSLKSESMILVNHGTNASYARPTGIGAAYWIASAEPVNAEAYDMWWSV